MTHIFGCIFYCDILIIQFSFLTWPHRRLSLPRASSLISIFMKIGFVNNVISICGVPRSSSSPASPSSSLILYLGI